ncbi:MAG TPA: D-glycero-beta-D-manno-heptose-7-phosphate kinase [Acidiferrobacteraceae bacterium]|nr:D-glycero-beta-D-manno-heptose-7-phosphate kinase [Acidiferrobacteraceae bacterium]
MLKDILHKMAAARVLVMGDAMLDRYWFGAVDRISPEAPVPVVAVDRSEERLGGAANVAANIAGLGARASLISPSGADAPADMLAKLAADAGIHCTLIRDALVNTTVKLRLVSRNQQLIRIDFETFVSKDVAARLAVAYAETLAGCDAVVVSDYGKGGLARVEEMIRLARERRLPVLVDPKGDDYRPYRGATLITPNRREFERVAGRFYSNEELERKARAMIAELDLEGILVTRSEEGMSLIERGGGVQHVPTRAREVYDVTGAGDTVIATVGAAYAAHAPVADAVHLANIAAGLVVGKLGAVAVDRAELEREVVAL